MRNLFLVVLCAGMAYSGLAQKKDSINTNYQRSSLALFLMEDVGMPMKDTILQSFNTAPFPDKFNNHNVAVRSFERCTTLTEEDQAAFDAAVNLATSQNAAEAPKKKGMFGKFLKAAASDASGGVVGATSKDEMAVSANKFLVDQKIAKQMFDKWFLDSAGNFSLALAQERGLYNATKSDVEQAASSVYGTASLADAGIDLVNNTFAVVCNYRYMPKDSLVALIGGVAVAAAEASGNSYAVMGAKAAMMALSASLGAGYYVVVNTYLFQLNWNDNVQNQLSQVWDNREAYDAADFYGFKYIGNTTGWAQVKAGIFTNKDQAELIRIATVNATDAAIAKLEKKYDVFKTKSPLMVAEDGTLYAHIGMKEGIEPKDKYEVLERAIDPKTGRTIYKSKGTITVVKDHIWDNRYMADQEPDHDSSINETYFEGKGDYYNGLLIRQIK
jgi:hypothetical protein